MRMLLFLLSVQMAFCQTKEQRNSVCARVGNMPLAERLSHFPFKQSDQIKVVAYRDKTEVPVGEELQRLLNSISIGEKIFSANDFDEVATLDARQTDRLSDIIFNYRFKQEPYVKTITRCYMPRNAILFLDKASHIIGWIELCFECGGERSSAEGLDLGEYCQGKFDLVKSIFKECKIVYGITAE